MNALLPDSTRLGAVRLQVTDLTRSLDYYEGVLGLSVAQRGSDEASLTAAGDSRPLLHLETHPGVHRPAGRRVGLYHFALLVPGRATLGRFVAHLAQVGERLASADHAVSEAIYLWDPDGLGIEVYADRPRSAWTKHGDEIYMTTEPLDLGSLVDAATGTTWAGMENGTVLGHMHLHVSDLARAAQFYHSGLGLAKTVWSYPGALFLAAGGYHHHLALNTWAGNAPPRAVDEAGLVEWEMCLPASAAASVREQFASQGVAVSDNGTASYSVTDEWGNAVRLISDTH